MYQPQKGDRIIVRRTPLLNGRPRVITGTVLDVVTIGGIEGVLDFRSDLGARAYLGTSEQLAAIGYLQTIEPMPHAA